MTFKFHRDAYGFPVWVMRALPCGSFRLDYQTHATDEARDDRYGNIERPATLDTRKAEVIEVETTDDMEVCKILYRLTLDTRRDLVLAIIPRRTAFIVKTVWVNLRSDKHVTLDKMKYDKVIG